MARPRRCCRVSSEPAAVYFKPRGIPMRALEEVTMSLEEFESIRVKDLEGLDQEAAAARMSISRPTYQRILNSARAKVADVLVNGKAIIIEGGNYEYAPHHGRGHGGCGCGHAGSHKEVAK